MYVIIHHEAKLSDVIVWLDTLFWLPNSDVINLLYNVHIQPTVEYAFF